MKVRKSGDIVILVPKGYYTTNEAIDELDRRMKEIVDRDEKWLLVNLAETQHLNSTALGILVSAHSSFVRRGGMMKICNCDKRIENIWIITKLVLVFDIYPTEEQAIASFPVSRPSRAS